jgi:hypothetical protein
MRQRQKPLKPCHFRPSKVRNCLPIIRTRNDGADGDDSNVEEQMLLIHPLLGVNQPAKVALDACSWIACFVHDCRQLERLHHGCFVFACQPAKFAIALQQENYA